jgi:quercetin dioxygenase-like cupin family protein
MFVQCQRLPWERRYRALRGEALDRVLSRDETSGAATVLLRYPPGWSLPRSEYLTTLEEIYVLQGSLQIGAQNYASHSYACLPAGFCRDGMRSDSGAIVLTMWSSEPQAVAATQHATALFSPELLIMHHDARAKGLDSWEQNTHTRYLPGTGVQTLRKDPYTGEITILYSALPYRFMEKRWTHEYVQEMYVLAGEYSVNDVGVMRPGAYAWWNPEHVHGPYGSLTGFSMLIRSCGGPLVNVIPPEPVAVDFAAPYRPVLPAALVPYAGESDTHQAF